MCGSTKKCPDVCVCVRVCLLRVGTYRRRKETTVWLIALKSFFICGRQKKFSETNIRVSEFTRRGWGRKLLLYNVKAALWNDRTRSTEKKKRKSPRNCLRLNGKLFPETFFRLSSQKWRLGIGNNGNKSNLPAAQLWSRTRKGWTWPAWGFSFQQLPSTTSIPSI